MPEKPPYTPRAASMAATLMHDAYDAWITAEMKLQADIGDVAWPTQMYGHAVGVVTWATALDELLDNPGGYTDYPDRRPDARQLLNAARYARHRAVHQLIPLAEPHAGYSTPFTSPLRGDLVYRWAPMLVMPDPKDEGGGRNGPVIRAAYADRWAGREMSPTLRELVDWFRTFTLPPR
jgi:hypothetical protein